MTRHTDLSKDWLQFWFGMIELMHPSWVETSDDPVIKEIFLRQDRSLICRYFSDYVLKDLDIPHCPEIFDSAEKIWKSLIPRLIENCDAWAACAGLVVTLNPAHSACHREKPIPNEISFGDLVKLSASLQFYRRIPEDTFENDREAGLWLLWTAFDKGSHTIWRRFRLSLPRDQVLLLETRFTQMHFSNVLLRNALRAIKMLVALFSEHSIDTDVITLENAA